MQGSAQLQTWRALSARLTNLILVCLSRWCFADLDQWELAALDSLAGACRSLLLASAVIKVCLMWQFV